MKVAVFFGGDSPESDISVITALQAMAELKGRVGLLPVYIKNGSFLTVKEPTADKFADFKKSRFKKLVLHEGVFYRSRRAAGLWRFRPDAALICCHGGLGENGGLQGLLELNGIPYTSAGITASAIGMNKIVQKEIFSALMLPVTDYLQIDRDEFLNDEDKIVMHVQTFLEYPVIVKPCSSGSSIGIDVAKNESELKKAVSIACEYDETVIVERALTDFVELNCAAVSAGNSITVSQIEKPLNWKDFLTFENKYGTGGKMSGAGRELPAEIPEELAEEIRFLTMKIYKELKMKGVVRTDYLYDRKENKLYVNEINTVPGSLAYYLFDELGISFYELLKIMFDGALKAYRSDCMDKKVFSTSVLGNFGRGGLKSGCKRR